MRSMSDAASARANTGSPTRRGFPWLHVLCATAIAVALRLPGLFEDPWIDEIWSWGLAQSRASAAEIFLIRSSNSHALNTLWMWVSGDARDFVVYRLPAFVGGVACVPLVARIASRAGRNAAVAAAWIASVAYLPIVYSGEARGYAPMCCASLAALECAWTWLDGGRRRWLVSTWISFTIGLLFQTLFVVAFVAIAVGVLARLRGERRSRALGLAALFLAPPLGITVAWWFLNVRHVFNAGAPPWDLAEVLSDTVAVAFGLPRVGWAIALGAFLGLVIVILDVRHLASLGNRLGVVQVGVVGVTSAVTVWLLWDDYLAARYFLVPIVFFGLSLARVLGRIADSGRAGAVIAALLFALFAAGNAAHTVPFLRAPRGTIGELVRGMAASSSANPIVVTGNFDFNVGALLEWHARSLPVGRTVRYVARRDMAALAPDFAVIEEPQFERDPVATIQIGNELYELVGTSRHAGPIGADWAVYQRTSR